MMISGKEIVERLSARHIMMIRVKVIGKIKSKKESRDILTYF